MQIVIRPATAAESAAAEGWTGWSCQPSSFEWGYADTEVSVIVEGEAVIEAMGQEFRVKAGDWLKLPKGLACRWTVTGAMRKYYRYE